MCLNNPQCVTTRTLTLTRLRRGFGGQALSLEKGEGKPPRPACGERIKVRGRRTFQVVHEQSRLELPADHPLPGRISRLSSLRLPGCPDLATLLGMAVLSLKPTHK